MLSRNRNLRFPGKYFLSGSIERYTGGNGKVQAVDIVRVLDPDGTAYLRIIGRKARCLVTEYKGERLFYIRILKEGTPVQHKGIDIIIGKSLPVVIESLEYLYVDPG